MKSLFDGVRLLICMGTGGVGKTTVSASLGVFAAQQGKRVLVMTIDPSQRLKTTLGLSDDGEIRKIEDPRLGTGELSACVVNSKRTFDDFVQRAAGPTGQADRILKNKLYIQLSTTLAGSQEFTALERLYQAAHSSQYDLVILDTPPSQHLMDFLGAPEKLSTIFNEKVTSWFRLDKKQGLFQTLFNTGTNQVLGLLEKLTGGAFMRELRDFFESIQSWQGQLQSRIRQVHQTLVAPTTAFVLISAPEKNKFAEALRFAKEIRRGGYRHRALIFNRWAPIWMKGSKADLPPGILRSWQEKVRNQMQLRNEILKEMDSQVEIFELPDDPSSFSDLNDLFRMVEHMKGIS